MFYARGTPTTTNIDEPKSNFGPAFRLFWGFCGQCRAILIVYEDVPGRQRERFQSSLPLYNRAFFIQPNLLCLALDQPDEV